MWRTIALVLCCLSSLVTAQTTLNVCAAISLKEALLKSADEFKQKNNCDIQFNFDASGTQATLIQSGSPCDVFICSLNSCVDQLIEKGKLDKSTRTVIASNELVLITPVGSKSITSFQDLARDSVKKIAIGEPSTEPAGEYANQTFKSLKIDVDVMSKLVYGANVRLVLDYVAKGEVEAGIVYRTDAIVAGDSVRVVSVADETWHSPIEYPAAVVTASGSKDLAKKYLDFLNSQPVKDQFCKQGFATTTQTATAPSTQPSTQVDISAKP